MILAAATHGRAGCVEGALGDAGKHPKVQGITMQLALGAFLGPSATGATGRDHPTAVKGAPWLWLWLWPRCQCVRCQRG